MIRLSEMSFNALMDEWETAKMQGDYELVQAIYAELLSRRHAR